MVGLLVPCWCHTSGSSRAAGWSGSRGPDAEDSAEGSLKMLQTPRKNGERGKLGQERLEVGWEAVMFLFNIVNLNV